MLELPSPVALRGSFPVIALAMLVASTVGVIAPLEPEVGVAVTHAVCVVVMLGTTAFAARWSAGRKGPR